MCVNYLLQETQDVISVDSFGLEHAKGVRGASGSAEDHQEDQHHQGLESWAETGHSRKAEPYQGISAFLASERANPQ